MIRLVCLALLSLVSYQASAEHPSLTISRESAILYYNSPAAVRIKDTVYVGYVTSKGSVEIAVVNLADYEHPALNKPISIHDYGKPDDHAAPALWPAKDGSIYAATAFHGSDLFLYKVNPLREAALICRWTGRFTYPRFDVVDGKVLLYIRTQHPRGGDVSIIRNPEQCSEPQVLVRAKPNTFIYAAPPDGADLIWSIFDRNLNQTTSVIAIEKELQTRPLDYPSTLAWSLAGPYWSVTRYKDGFECCKSGEMIAELYKGAHLVYASGPMPTAYYPRGITISREGSEGLFPTPDMKIERRTLEDQKILPSCSGASDINTNPQYVVYGGGAYIFQSFHGHYDLRNIETSSVHLCLHR